MKREVILTRDGSTTIAIPEWKVMYHSIHGAVKESQHVYIRAGLQYAFAKVNDTPLRIFEMGFGTGLNALLTVIEARSQERSVAYTTIETYLLTEEEITSLDYGKQLQAEALFQQLHKAPWDNDVEVNPFITLKKQQVDLINFSTDQLFHLIYYDAFAPAAQPELWTSTIFKKLYSLLVPGGILVTYCAKGIVKRAMQHAGFTVSHLQGPPGKREMLRATAGPLSPEGGT